MMGAACSLCAVSGLGFWVLGSANVSGAPTWRLRGHSK